MIIIKSEYKIKFKLVLNNLSISSFSFEPYQERSNRAGKFRGAEITVVHCNR